ncbi:hypothetical protein UFOVP713_45 [uncultured Caudovirales phage]|uniref:Uncharacterized protein n=1 Tax=uncultured Caudovirales phage TaxID=2100421 RepID=A0A6J5NGZ6_9CAUD|nr:hypothetical protein UFOVP713_45 [uncultured Caudovirales phage]
MSDLGEIAIESGRIAAALKVEFAGLIRKYDPKFASMAMIDAATHVLAMAMVPIEPPHRDLALAHITKEIDSLLQGYSISWETFQAGANSARKRMEDGE